MRQALELRYRLIPYLYSLMHLQHDALEPTFRPLSYYWPEDMAAVITTDQWLVGAGLMVAPVVREGGGREVYLPRGLWYTFDAAASVVTGPRLLSLSPIPLADVPVYARAGAVIH